MTACKGTTGLAYLLGTALLSRSLAAESGSRRFYVCTYATATTWTAGGLLDGEPGRRPRRAALLRRRSRTSVSSEAIGVGVVAFAGFYAGAHLARRIPPLRRALAHVLRHAHTGSTRWIALTTAINGVAEEIFFRGVLYDPDHDHPVTRSTVLYMGTVAGTRNPALLLASAVMGTLFAWQRNRGGGLTAPILTHLTWSMLMIRFLTPLFQEESP